MIAVLCTLAITLASIAYVVLPLFGKGPAASMPTPPSGDRLSERQEETYAALRDLSFEFEVGHLTADDYFSMRERYARRAMALLKLADDRDQAAADAVEDAIRTLKAARSAPVVEATPRACPRCGGPAVASASRCAVCGYRTTVASRAKDPSRGVSRRWLIAIPSAMALFAVGSIMLTFELNQRQSDQRPVATLPTQAVRGFVVSPNTSGALILAAPDALSRSVDGGKSWLPLRGGGTLFALAATGAPGSGSPRLWLADRDAVLVSSDGGGTFVKVGNPSPGQDVRALAANPSNPNDVYALTSDGALTASHDGGVTWNAMNTAASPVSGPPADAATMVVVSGDPITLFVASPTAGVVASYDLGKSWSPANGFVNGLLPTRGVQALVYDPASGDRFVGPNGEVMHGAMYAATDAGLWKSIDQGGSWSALPLRAPAIAVAIDPADPAHIDVVDTFGQLFVSRDRGVTWKD